MSIVKNILKGYGMLSLGIVGGVLAGQAAVYTSDKQIKNAIINVWNENKDIIVKDLGLKKMPTLDFDDVQANALMYVRCTYKTISKFLSFESEVTEVIPDYIIHINVPAIAKQCREINAATFRRLHKDFILCLFRHECRHLYQQENQVEVGKKIEAFKFTFNEAHGAEPMEVDANTYAINKAEGFIQKEMAELNLALQMQSGKLFVETDDIKKHVKKLSRVGFLYH